MSKHSDLYNQVREEIARWPQWKINAYNEMFATSAHAEKVTPHTPTNADRIRNMSDEELAEYIFDLGNGSEYCYGHCAYQDDCATKGLDHDTCIKGVIDWLKQPAKEKHK